MGVRVPLLAPLSVVMQIGFKVVNEKKGKEAVMPMEEVNQILQKSVSADMQPSVKVNDSNKFCSFKVVQVSSHLLKASVEIAPSLVEVVYQQTVELFKRNSVESFHSKEMPFEYIEETFQGEILAKLKDFFFEYLVFDFLSSEIVFKKIKAANYPRLANIQFSPDRALIYIFDVSLADPINMKEWKNFAFKSPGRKRYKDLDKQVENFIEEESEKIKTQASDVIVAGDWICFKATLLDKNQMPLVHSISGFFWIKVRGDLVSTPFSCNFLRKKINNSFIADNFNFSDDDDDHCEKGYNFLITILSVLKGNQISFDMFKSVFKLKNRSEIHNKLVEVFSYRNDLSQRRAIIEEVFNLLLAKHRFEVPKHLVLRRQEDILKSLAKQPDYHVYKAQRDFLTQVETLAEKQIKEEIIIDQIAQNDGLNVDLKDMEHYLHFFNNKRLQKFVYFMPQPIESIDDLSIAINAGLLLPTVLREKTLNFIINTLTK